LLMRVI
jgi:hypothetical protein